MMSKQVERTLFTGLAMATFGLGVNRKNNDDAVRLEQANLPDAAALVRKDPGATVPYAAAGIFFLTAGALMVIERRRAQEVSPTSTN